MGLVRLLFCGALVAMAPRTGAGEILGPLTAPSPAAGGALTYAVYLPDLAACPCPVVYLLHGFGGTYREWIGGGHIDETLDRMIAGGEIAPMIAVMPDAGKSWYVDSARFGGPGDYETAILRDLIPAIDARFPTIPDRAHRAIAGNSMGGFGALRLAFAHPDTFASVVGFSPGLFNPGAMSGDWMGGTPAGEMDEWYPRTFGESFDAEIYASRMPFAYVRALGAMAGPPAIMLIVGDDDYFELYDGTTEMFLALRAEGLKPEFRVADGGHDWKFWRPMEPEALRFLDTAWTQPAQ